PLLSAPHTANTLFAKSIPIVVTSIADPCISTTASQNRLRRGRSTDPSLPGGQSGEEQEPPRRNHRRSQVRTVAGNRLAPGRNAQGGRGSAKGEEEQMDKPAVWVGVDVSKEQLEVALRPSGEHFSLPNDERALRTLVKRLLPLKCARIVVEATGGYETLVVAAA